MPSNSVALSRLLVAERELLMRQVQRFVGRDGAEDVAQKLWIKIQNVRDIPPILDKKAYLRRLAHNVAVDQLRDDARQDTVAERSRALLWGSDQTLDPERIVGSQEMLRQIRAAIIAMPEPTRTILRLTRIEGKKQREVAEIVGVSSTTVENHLRRALALLADVRDGGAQAG